jgi:hypothetical protein
MSNTSDEYRIDYLVDSQKRNNKHNKSIKHSDFWTCRRRCCCATGDVIILCSPSSVLFPFIMFVLHSMIDDPDRRRRRPSI